MHTQVPRKYSKWRILKNISINRAIHSKCLYNIVKALNFIGTKFCSLTTMDMSVDSWIVDFKRNITEVNKYFVANVNSWIALPTKNMKLNVKPKKRFYSSCSLHDESLVVCEWCVILGMLEGGVADGHVGVGRKDLVLYPPLVHCIPLSRHCHKQYTCPVTHGHSDWLTVTD